MILGVGLANKHSIGFFGLAVVIGVLLSGGRPLRNRYFVAGVAVAAIFCLPDLWWQATHGWATIDMTHALARENGGFGNGVSFVFSQLFMASPILIPMWLLGLRSLWRSGVPLWRALVWSYALLIVFFAVTSGAKPYYVAAFYPMLIAAGAVVLEQRWPAAGEMAEADAGLCGVVLTVSVLVTLPFRCPCCRSETAGCSKVNPVPAETVGWPQLVGQVANVWHSLPAGERTDAVIFTANYGEAGAINELGGGDRLPGAVSGHNSEWFWGPGNADATTVVAVVAGEAASPTCAPYVAVRPAAWRPRSTTWGVANQEEGGHIYVCRDPVRSWGALWPRCVTTTDVKKD